LYEHNADQLVLPHEFFLPFDGQLNPNNRWVVLARLIPWSRAEKEYIKSLGDLRQGNKAFSVRLALGALIIQERLNLSDEETVRQITENPYLQYFIGLPSFQDKAPFHPSSMTHFRKRLGHDIINRVNEWVAEAQTKPSPEEPNQDGPSDDDQNGTGCSVPDNSNEQRNHQPNRGKLLLDATCAPADIAYPTDLRLLNEAREKLEGIIDTMHEPCRGKQRKPRTYRKKARKAYLAVAKQRNPRKKTLRKALRQQLNFVKRNLKHVETLAAKGGLELLSKKQYRDLLVIQELYRQQLSMYKNKSHRAEHRIVSIQQPHVRPIVRGKSNASVEFGAKLSVSVVDGFAFLDVIQWDAYHEGSYLQESVEAYRRRYGVYPEAVLADQIYRTRENLQYCKNLGIRLSGPKLGRPSKDKQESSIQKQIEYQDALDRNAVEGKFGEGKRAYGLGLIRARLQETSETVIALQFLIMNLEKILRDTFFSFFHLFIRRLCLSHRFGVVIFLIRIKVVQYSLINLAVPLEN
jgi:hypothetical protein